MQIANLPSILQVFVVFVLLGATPSITKAQDYNCYHKIICQAQISCFNKNYDKGIHQYQKAFDMASAHPFDLIDISIAYLHIGKEDKALESLYAAFDRGYTLKALKEHEGVNEKLDSIQWLIVEKKYTSHRQNFFCQANMEIYTQLAKMKAIDQSIRKLVHNHKDSTTWKYTEKIDQKNFQELQALLADNSNLTYNQLGTESIVSAYLILLHASSYKSVDKEQVDNMLDDFLRRGYITPNQYAIFVDRQNVFGEGKKQTYGTFNYATQFSPIEDVANIDQRRLEIGLYPLPIYVEKDGKKELPEGYVPFENPAEYLECN
ncbi:MAG: DUF6624 domain-containing protein [Chitinophagales bacterium]